MKRTIVVTGATGNIGSKLADHLLAQSVRVRAVGRDASRLQGFENTAAETAIGDLGDVRFTTQAMSGATGVFALIPPNYGVADLRAYQNTVSESLATAIQKTGVRYVVHLSSVGAQHAGGTGPIAGLYDSERRFNELPGVNVVHLRPTFFMENQLMNIPAIKRLGVNGSPVKAALSMAHIATRDIAHAAARLLADATFEGKTVRELLGPRNYTMTEVTTILGAAIGKPDLRYVEFSYDDTEEAFLGLGMSPDVAGKFIEMYKAVNGGLVAPERGRTPEATTPTTFEEFARTTFAPAFAGR